MANLSFLVLIYKITEPPATIGRRPRTLQPDILVDYPYCRVCGNHKVGSTSRGTVFCPQCGTDSRFL